MKDIIKKYGVHALIAVLFITCFSKCTTSCTRGAIINKQNNTIAVQDSIINAQRIRIDSLGVELATRDALIAHLKESNTQLSDIASATRDIASATNTQLSTINSKISKIEKENNNNK